ncbi:peptidase M16 inactive domain-containing protein [Aphelenchoides avenae]|nr:peptidase M16 inactive domain-containing protein [Aphelenchus avenae]
MLSRFAARRSFSAAAKPAPLRAAVEEKVSRLQNGLTVASVDQHGPVSQLVLAFRAGSRYEQPDEAGLVHLLRNTIGKDSEKYLGVKLLWQVGGIGSSLVSTATKDLLTVQVNVARHYAPVALSLLGELAEPASKPWDVDDAVGTLKIDLDHQQPFDIAVELLHKAAFRNGQLGNPILGEPQRVGKVSWKQLSAYTKARLVSSEAAIVAINVDHGVLLRYGSEQSSIPDGSGKAAAEAKYFGGDARANANTPLAHVLIAGNGAKLTDIKSVAIHSVLSAVIGQGSTVEHSGRPGNGVVAKAVEQALNHQPVSVNGLNVVHSDAGLTGVYLVAEGSRIERAVRAAADAIKKLGSSGPDAETLEAAKRQAETETLVRAENASEVAVDQAAQLLANGAAVSPADFAKQVASVSAEDVKKAAQQVASKLSVSAVGNVHAVPYADQL